MNDQVKPVDIQSVNSLMISEPVESKVNEDRQATGMSCCPQSQMNSHSDAECPAALPKQTNKRKTQTLRIASRAWLLSGKRRASNTTSSKVVIKGKCPVGLQFVPDTDNNNLFACYLLSVF